MRKSTQPARHRNGAWQSSNEMGSIRDYGTLPTEHISLKESTFGQAAELKIQLDLNPEEITSYRRFMDETKKILYTEFVYKETPVKILAFASKKEDLLYYEITAENTCLNLTAKVKPAEEKAYRNYNLGEKGLHIKNASRVAFRIHLASSRRKASATPLCQAMEMQMSMNRYLAKTDDISREKLIEMQK